ncbi:tandem-95 repeat protein [Alcanivorax sp. DP30]|uniref:tandem-95 repeat protein n=1 Tax=Alcanivorax sp. DP30 TaxID=2606217 RepID=UPI00136CE406|nr:tandem-95 repeat protein [Alcanivorax sp. DP30]MZR64406.1 tandem-95 repeat protein [Alcanivorax sp. DP30]
MQFWRSPLALLVLAGSLLSGAAQADFIQIDGFTPVIGSANRTVTQYPLPSSSTTTNGSTFSESGGKANLTLGGNGNTAGAVELVYSFASPIDLTDGGTNDQFFLVMDSINRPNAPEGESTALSVSINVTGGGRTGTYGTGIGSVPAGQSLALNFYCDVNPVCFSQGQAPDFSSITQIRVWLAFPKNYANSADTTTVVMDSIHVTPGGGSFPPQFTTAPTNATYREGSAGSPVQFAASGVPSPNISLTGTLPSGVTWDSTEHRISGTPATGTGGVYPLQIKASSSVGSISKTFTLNVEAPPTITSSAATTFQQGLNGSFTMTATGYPAPTFSLSSGSLPPGVTLSSAGVISGTPTSSTGNYSLAITASNGISPNASQAFTLTVNRPPNAAAFSLNGQEDTPLTIPASAFANAITELDGQAVSVVISSLPVGASAGSLKKANGSAVSLGEAMPLASLDHLTFEPASNWSGSTSFGWQATDGTLSSAMTSANLTFAAVNDAPVIAEGSTGNYATDEDNSLSVTLSVSDVDNVDLTTVTTLQPLHGSLEINGATVIYTPELNYHGTDSYTVQVQDGAGGIAEHAFSVTVTSVNDLPAIEQGDTVNLTIDEDNTPTAFALQLNASDVEDGTANTLVWSLQSAAGNGTASVSGTGPSPVVEYSPDADYNGNDSFVVRVTDSNGGFADFTVYLTITASNDTPRIDGAPLETAVENVPWSFTPTITDPEAEPLTLTLTGKPDWASFDDSTGALTGTPGNGDVGSSANMTLTVDDGNSTATRNFSVTVLADFDGDTIPDVDDSDIDDDGMDNDFEEAAGLDPYDDSDASGDLDSDGISNLDEFNNGSNPTEDDYPPVLAGPGPVYADATGLFTLMDLGELVAEDGRDGPIAATPDSGYYLSGFNYVERTATDQAGNQATVLQAAHIDPQVSFAPPMVSAEGDTLTVTAYLSGPAHAPVVNVPFTLSGTSDGADHDLAAGVLTFDYLHDGKFETSTTVNFTNDGIGEGTETLQLVMGELDTAQAVPGLYTQQDIVIHEDNVAPTATLVASQNGRPTRIVIPDQGPVTVTATVDDANPADSLSSDWTDTDAELVDTDADDSTFTFDPALLTAGTYTLALAVSDGTLVDDTSLTLNVLTQAPLLGSEDSDSDGPGDDLEGFGDQDNDGVPDYLDAMEMGHVLQAQPGVANQYLLETEPGLDLQLGATSLALGDGAATLQIQTLIDTFNVSLPAGIRKDIVQDASDLIIDGLQPGASAVVIVPQSSPLPADARFIALASQDWQPVASAKSAPGAEGYCPSPYDSQYRNGLHAGDYCVSLTVTDGSAHDADGKANGRISLRGAAASGINVAAIEEKYDPFASGSGTSGSSGGMLLLILAAMGLIRRQAYSAN